MTAHAGRDAAPDRIPAALAILAALLLALHLVCGALGWRAHSAALLGGHGGQVLRGALYIASHLATVVLAPTFLLAALLYGTARRLLVARARQGGKRGA